MYKRVGSLLCRSVLPNVRLVHTNTVYHRLCPLSDQKKYPGFYLNLDDYKDNPSLALRTIMYDDDATLAQWFENRVHVFRHHMMPHDHIIDIVITALLLKRLNFAHWLLTCIENLPDEHLFFQHSICRSEVWKSIMDGCISKGVNVDELQWFFVVFWMFKA